MKKLVIAGILALASFAAAAGVIITLLLNATTTGAGTGVNYASFGAGLPTPNRWFQATLSGASAVSATVEIDGSTDNTNWVPIATLNPTAASSTLAIATQQTAPWIRGNVLAISGTGATVTLQSGL
jgi:hypothetical protein